MMHLKFYLEKSFRVSRLFHNSKTPSVLFYFACFYGYISLLNFSLYMKKTFRVYIMFNINVLMLKYFKHFAKG